MKISTNNGRLIALTLVAAVVAMSAFTGLYASPLNPSVVKGDGALGYYRFDDSLTRNLINVNSGSLGAAGNATNDLATITGGVVHSIPGALAGDSDRAVFFDFTTRTEIPFNAALNTPNTQPFTVEAWLYPVNDQDTTSFGGMGVLANRWTQGGNRQGWVMYQRRPNADYAPAAEGVGWEFRMYNDLDGSGHLDVVSGVPFELGKWQHVAIVYEPIGGDATNSTVTIYIDGQPANTNINTALAPGYAPCTGAHDPAPNGQPAIAIGNYNNANSGTFGAANPWFGGADEFAWYPAKLSPAQILAHYQNGTNANRTQSYSSLILSDNPTAYLRLNEIAPGGDIAVNLGSVGRDAGGGIDNGTGGAAGLGNHTSEVRHPAGGAVASDKKSGATAYHLRNGNSTTTIPFDLENNGRDPNDPTTNSAGVPFTFETWLRPMKDTQGGQAPVNNRSVGGTGRTGWVIFQRNPNSSYPVSEFYGWNFRMFSGVGSSGQDILTGTETTQDVSAPYITNYTIGKWQHMVVTWQPDHSNGDLGANGNDQWQGTLTGYIDGVPVITNANILYAANRLVPEAGANTASGGAPADLAIGSYNAASGIGANPYEGDVAELAIYNNYVMTPVQVLAHYQAGTNANFNGNYATMVLTAAAIPPITERTTLPATYFRLNDIARYPAANSGSLGAAADGNLILTTNNGVGPITAGFENPNPALPLDGVKQWASFNNPSGLNISGQITLEAWIKPGATQGPTARIVTHGTPTPSNFDPTLVVYDGALTTSNEVFLRIEGSGATYAVGSSDGFTTQGASAAVPGGDLGSASWIHLAGTYDGTTWRLYRNGTQIASSAAATGALPVNGGDWAVGATGNGWADNFTGQIDEAAIYGTALQAGKIKAHYYVGSSGTVSLTIVHNADGSVTVTWPAGVLQSADNVSGPYTNVTVSGSPAASPYNTPTGTKKFYRACL